MLKVAKVLKPQGLKGEIKVEMLSRDSAFWQRGRTDVGESLYRSFGSGDRPEPAW